MSEASEGFPVKPEPNETDVKDTTLLTNIPIGESIDLQQAVVIVPENSDGNMSINTIHESNNVVVLASMTSDGELITPDDPSAPENDIEPDPEPEPRDPNTCTHCGKVFRSQTVKCF